MAVAIIGAGMAGLTAARALADAGRDVVVFEKSKGLGGRMATRQVDQLQFDHGATGFLALRPAFQAQVELWQSAGLVGWWRNGEVVGVPRMTAPAKALAEGLRVERGVTVTSLARAAGGWRIVAADLPAPAATAQPFEAVIMAIPAPQAADLATSAGLVMVELARAAYAPCWTLLLAYPAGTAVIDGGPIGDGVIDRIVRDDLKPGRPAGADTLVVQASATWTRQNLDLSAERAGERLLAHVRDVIGCPGTPTLCVAHRWRYARVDIAAAVPCVWNARSLIGACGDWCLGSTIEDAFDSGRAMADVVLADNAG